MELMARLMITASKETKLIYISWSYRDNKTDMSFYPEEIPCLIKCLYDAYMEMKNNGKSIKI